MQLKTISTERYARDVLPRTAALWAGRRSFAQYAEQTLELAASGYGRRHYATIGLYDGGTLVASFKRYERAIRAEGRRLHAIGFGAVFTPVEHRGRGYASFMLASALDRARNDGYDVAYLFSDIHPQFYAAVGFRALRSRQLSLRAEALPSQRLAVAVPDAVDCSGVRRCFERCERRRRSAFLRTPSLWSWIALRIRHGSEHPSGHPTNLVHEWRGGVRAYVLGARAPARDAYVVDEYGFADDAGAAVVPSLLRAAAGDLRRIIGWLPPEDARQILPSGATRARKDAILMMAPLSSAGTRLVSQIAAPQNGEYCWATDHI